MSTSRATCSPATSRPSARMPTWRSPPAEEHDLLLQPEPEEREPGQAGGARGVQIPDRLRCARRYAAQGHRRDPPELPAEGHSRRARRQALQAGRRQGQGSPGQGRPRRRLLRHDGHPQRPAGAGRRRSDPADGGTGRHQDRARAGGLQAAAHAATARANTTSRSCSGASTIGIRTPIRRPSRPIPTMPTIP